MSTRSSRIHPVSAAGRALQIPIYSFHHGCYSGRIVRTGKNGRAFFLSDDGTLMFLRHGNGVAIYERKNIAAYFGSNDLASLRKLGIITAEEIRASKARCAAAAQKKQRRKDLQELRAIKKRLKRA